MARKDRIADVLEAILDRLDTIDANQRKVIDVTVQLTRDVSEHDAELSRIRRKLVHLPIVYSTRDHDAE